MNVYIISTPEYSSVKVDEVIALLKEIPGELKFEKGQQLIQAQYKRIDRKFEDFTEIKSFTFKEYFNLIQGYRDFRTEVKEQDFVILITSIRHDRNWFSGFQNRNIFVHGDEWDIISDVDSKFGIAYQCVENIFQSLINLDIMNYRDEPNIHLEPIGCINDFCGYKPDILRKLRMADICDSCYNRYTQTFGNNAVILQILNIIEEIRKEFVAIKRIQRFTKLEKVKIDDKGNIFIGTKLLEMQTLPKVLYITFLKYIEGIESNKLCENQNRFQEIYKKIKKNPDPQVIEKLCCPRIEKASTKYSLKPTFETNRTRVKNALVEILGTTLANYYHINYVEAPDHTMLFKVPLSSDNLDWDGNFT